MFALRKFPLYPSVMILASQMSGSSGRNFDGQKRSKSSFFDRVTDFSQPASSRRDQQVGLPLRNSGAVCVHQAS